MDANTQKPLADMTAPLILCMGDKQAACCTTVFWATSTGVCTGPSADVDGLEMRHMLGLCQSICAGNDNLTSGHKHKDACMQGHTRTQGVKHFQIDI